MRDRLILYDVTHDPAPAVDGAIPANTLVDLAAVESGEHAFIIEEMHLYSPYNAAGAPAGLDRVQILIDGEPFPATPGRMHIRGMAERSMASPYDQRFARGPVPLGKISLDPLEDTTIKISPAQRVSVRLWADATGILVTDSRIRVMLLGRIADTDAELREIYGGAMYQPGGISRLGDPVTGKISPPITKTFPLTIDNVKRMSGATAQDAPRITPFWTFGVNRLAIPDVPEYPWSAPPGPFNVATARESMEFNWTRIKDRALQIHKIGAYMRAPIAPDTEERARIWIDQPPLRRPGHKNLFFGWVVDAGFPQMLPGGGAPAMPGAGMFQGPYDLDPKVLAYNNLTQVRVQADPGTAISAGALEIQIRGTYIAY